MKALGEFMRSFDFVKLRPNNAMIKSGLPEKAKAYALAEHGRQYALYIFGGPQSELGLDIPAANYEVQWVSPLSGEIVKRATLKHKGGVATLNSPPYNPDIALGIRKSAEP
jgi:hypothetical protein